MSVFPISIIRLDEFFHRVGNIEIHKKINE